MDDESFLGGASEDIGDDCLFCLTSTLPVDGTCLLEDVLETQLLDPTAETQMVDFSVEVLDDVAKCHPVNIASEFDAGTFADETEVDSRNHIHPVPVSEMLNLDSSAGNPGGLPVRTEGVPSQYTSRQYGNPPGTSSDKCRNKQRHSGSFYGGFTSIRVASVRACGLAAQANRNLCRPSSKPQFCGQDGSPLTDLLNFGRTTGGELLPSECQKAREKLTSSDQCKVRNTIVRKLFREADDTEVGLPEFKENSSTEVCMPQVLPSEDCFFGLRYVDSQEPGELSQSHALMVVDKLINLNGFELAEDFDTRFRTADTVKTISSAKGCRDLAQHSVVQSLIGGCEVFDWDEKRENDDGGDFFLKKKKLFFDDGISNLKCRTRCPKSRCLSLGGANTEHGDETEKKNSQRKAGNPGHSDSQVLQQNCRGKRKSSCHKEQHLTSSLNKDLCFVKHNLACSNIKKGFLDMKNMGPDTQMAVEAMENLCLEAHLTETVSDVSKGANNSYITFKTDKCDGNSHPEHTCDGVVAGHPENRGDINSGVNSNSSLEKSRRIGCHTISDEAAKKNLSELEHHSVEHLENATCVTRNSTELNGSPLRRTRSSGARVKIKITANSRNGKVFNTGKSRNLVPSEPKRSREGFLDKFGPSDVDVVESTAQVIPLHQTLDNGSSMNEQKGTSETTAKNPRIACRMEYSAGERCETSSATCTAPHDFIKNVNNTSPMCMGDEYARTPCRKRSSRSSLKRELNNLAPLSPETSCEMSVLRKRRDIAETRVLFSQHLDIDVITQQKKILARLGGISVSSISDASHFVADEFVRTRNMLEAIAFGKPVVTQLWLQSCGQANCLIDEKNYILRDARREKEFRFCLPASLARACHNPLLQGRKVFITPNAKPGKDTLANLVKAVGGLPVERLSQCMLKDKKLLDDLLILTCQEDYDVCAPFLEQGAAVYSTELLLNGIVKQKLEYERHRLYVDNEVKRTRSTIWVKTRGRCPVKKIKI